MQKRALVHYGSSDEDVNTANELSIHQEKKENKKLKGNAKKRIVVNVKVDLSDDEEIKVPSASQLPQKVTAGGLLAMLPKPKNSNESGLQSYIEPVKLLENETDDNNDDDDDEEVSVAEEPLKPLFSLQNVLAQQQSIAEVTPEEDTHLTEATSNQPTSNGTNTSISENEWHLLHGRHTTRGQVPIREVHQTEMLRNSDSAPTEAPIRVGVLHNSRLGYGRHTVTQLLEHAREYSREIEEFHSESRRKRREAISRYGF